MLTEKNIQLEKQFYKMKKSIDKKMSNYKKIAKQFI